MVWGWVSELKVGEWYRGGLLSGLFANLVGIMQSELMRDFMVKLVDGI